MTRPTVSGWGGMPVTDSQGTVSSALPVAIAIIDAEIHSRIVVEGEND